jgi:hypothetical protein
VIASYYYFHDRAGDDGCGDDYDGDEGCGDDYDGDDGYWVTLLLGSVSI